MSTVNKDIAEAIIANDGYYGGGDPRVVRVVRYNNQWDGGEAFGLVYAHEDLDRYHSSPACRNPETIWEAAGAVAS